MVQHLGRHVATERGANDGGRELALMVNAVRSRVTTRRMTGSFRS